MKEIMAQPSPIKPSWPFKLELGVYAMVVFSCFCLVVRRGMELSGEFESGGPRQGLLRRLKKGWLFGRSMDVSDMQWRAFRENLPLLTAVMGAFICLSFVARRFSPNHILTVHLAFSAAYVGYAHGTYCAFPFLLVVANFAIANAVKGRSYGPGVIWAYSCSVLFLARLYSGFSFRMISPGLQFLDAYGGSQRWDVCYNMAVLRSISYGIDLHNAVSPREKSKKGQDAERLPVSEYGLGTYLAYIFYPPLYIAGPIMTYDSYASQLKARSHPGTRAVLLYLGRLLGAMLILEVMTHTLYFNAIAQQRVWKRWQDNSIWSFSAFDIGITGFWVLNFMWLKFLVIWRYFRCCAMMEGIQPPENMLRCVNNNYDIEGFWRGWHSSFNRWLVRYLYIPLGGSAYRVFNVWVIFTFVALWHDLEWRLLGWAWLTCLVFAPELAAKWAIKQPWAASVRGHPGYRFLAGLGATCNIVMLMAANLLGFVTGLDGLPDFLRALVQDKSFLCAVAVAFFSAAQVMFALRDWEKVANEKRRRTE